MDVEQRARELLARAYEADGMVGRAGAIRNPTQYMEKPDRRALRCIIAVLTPPDGYVLVPVEPTAEMLQAAAFGVAGKSGQKFKPMMSAGYAAMIAARPEVP